MPTPHLTRPVTQLADLLAQGHGLSAAQLSDIMGAAFGGSDAAGAWSWRQAYDVMQAAALVADTKARARDRFGALKDLSQRLLTETRRSERQIRLQQFSTPLPYAWLLGEASGATAADLVLEPSAGTGALARMAEARGAALCLNEIDPFRAALLRATFGGDVLERDAEHINDLLPGPRPSVVLMNPPFSSSAKREDPTMVGRHLVSAALALRPGGRLVAIVPERFGPEGDRTWWARLAQIAAPRLRIAMPGAVYRKLGTSIGTALLVCDKTEGEVPCRLHAARTLDHAAEILSQEAPPRAALSDAPHRVVQTASRPQPKRPGPAPKAAPARVAEIALSPREQVVQGETVSDIFATYAPQRITFDGAGPHPSPLVESLAMASVVPPLPTARPRDCQVDERTWDV